VAGTLVVSEQGIDATPLSLYERCALKILFPADWILSQSMLIATTVVVAVMIARSGINTEIDPRALYIAKMLPHPVSDYRGLVVISPILFRLFGLHGYHQWAILHVVILEIFLVIFVILLRRRFARPDQRLFVMIMVAASGMAVVTLNQIGFYDVYMYIGAVLLVWATNTPSALIAGALFGATNPEEGVAAMVALVIVAVALRRSILRRVLLALGALVIVRLGLQLWFFSYGVHAVSRYSVLSSLFTSTTGSFTISWPVQVYSWYSAAWPALLVLVWRSGPRRLLVFFAVIILPFFAELLALDGTRVFAGTVFAAYLLLVTNEAELPDERAALRHRLSSLTLTVMALTPGVFTFWAGEVLWPWIPGSSP
jgi:hypothetical protein